MVEFASWHNQSHEDMIRFRCRNAPEFVRANIDAARESRGLPPLWATNSRRSDARARAAAVVARMRSFLAGVSAGER